MCYICPLDTFDIDQYITENSRYSYQYTENRDESIRILPVYQYKDHDHIKQPVSIISYTDTSVSLDIKCPKMTKLPKFITKLKFSLKLECCTSLLRIDELSNIHKAHIMHCYSLNYIGTIHNLDRLLIGCCDNLIDKDEFELMNIDKTDYFMSIIAPFQSSKRNWYDIVLIDYPSYKKGIQRLKEVIRMRQFLRHCNRPAFWHPTEGMGGRLHLKSMTKWVNTITK
jgi:hypothetical protein